MSRIALSSVIPGPARTASSEPIEVESTLTLLGVRPVESCWSGLYGTSSTRDGLMHLLRTSSRPAVIFRVFCEIPGSIISRIGRDDLEQLGYLNLRYADAALMAQIESCWAKLAGIDDGQEAILSRPDLVRSVLAKVGIKNLSIVIHPARLPVQHSVFTVGTILDPTHIVGVSSRDPGLQIRLPRSSIPQC